MTQERPLEQKIAELNARIDRLPRWGLSPIVFVVVGLAYFFAFYDISTIAYTLPTLIKRFNITEAQAAYPVSANLIGYMVGAYVLGNLADSLGRRRALLINVIILAIGGLLTALSWDVWSLSGFRFITGAGTGAEIALAASIITEFSPSTSRGRFVAINYLWGAVGLAVTPFIAIFLLNTFPNAGWRIVFGLGALVAAITIFMRGRWLPDSPRWMVLNGREDEADNLVSDMERRCKSATGHDLPPISIVPAEHSPEKQLPTRELFRPPYRRRALVVLGFWSTWYVTVYAFLGYYPTILIQRGLSESSGLLYSALGALAIPIGGVLSLLLMNVGQRKYLLSIVAFVFTAALALAALSQSGFLLFLGSFVSSMMIANSFGYMYTAETFPTRARATGFAIGDGFGHIGGVVAPFIVTASLGAVGATGTLWIMAAFVFVSGLIILLGGIRTTDKLLTEIAD